MGRGWLFGAAAVGILTGILFAAFPQLDVQISGWFWDPVAARFPLATQSTPNVLRKIGDWTVWLIVIAAAGALIAKLLFPRTRMLIRPTIVLFLLSSYAVGPGFVTNSLLKPYWSRPRPVHIEQFAGREHFEPWWRPGGDCADNCSFVSGDAAQAFWLLAPASVVPAPVKPVALVAATAVASGLSLMRVAFGRHFLTDIAFAGVLTIIIVTLLHYVFLNWRMRDDKLEQRLERLAFMLRSPSALGVAIRRLARPRSDVPSKKLDGAERLLPSRLQERRET